MLKIKNFRFLSVIFSLLLGGCFRPLYGPSVSVDQSVRKQLKTTGIDISASKETSGFLKYEFGSALRFNLTGGQEVPGTKIYRFSVRLNQVTTPALFDIQQGMATNLLLSVTADFKLQCSTGEDTPFSGKATTSVIMNQNPQGFANLREERDAHRRVARTLADQIYYRLAMYFVDRSSKTECTSGGLTK